MKGNQVAMKIIDDNICYKETSNKNVISRSNSEVKEAGQGISSLNVSNTSNNDVKTIRISRNSVNLSTVMLESVQEGKFG